MGEGAGRLSEPGSVTRVEGEIDALRGQLGSLIGELDRRRHEAFDLGLQARRHPVVVIAVAAAAALVAGGLVALALRRRRERRRPIVRARETRRALARLLRDPERVAAKPRPARDILTAAGVAAGSLLARRLAERIVSRAVPPQPGRAEAARPEAPPAS